MKRLKKSNSEHNNTTIIIVPKTDIRDEISKLTIKNLAKIH